jgi:hypothetical protein
LGLPRTESVTELGGYRIERCNTVANSSRGSDGARQRGRDERGREGARDRDTHTQREGVRH